MKVRFIINPMAGAAGRLKGLTGAVRGLLGADPGIFEVRATDGAGSAGAIARDAVAKGFEFVFACGGDGTVNEVASELVGTRTALGLLPAGSGNALARTLKVPFDPAGAVGLLKTGSVRPMDVGVACNRYFFTTAGFAFEGALSRRYNKGGLASRVRGLAPYYALAFVEYLRYRPERMTLTVDGREEEVEPFLLTAANTAQWGGDAFISPGAVVDDGLLDFCVVPRPGTIKTIALGFRVMRGSVQRYKGFRVVRGSAAVVRGRSAGWAHVDGEPFETGGDLSISVIPGGVLVLAPPV